ncbi:hypothetical protein P171DRAFT_437795 [Karstenula rhodostoma CBS 690.94]|uniref:C2H2-type domain-containing protein n=1 Tax=Karstenula rhodostoma CBS 690.94 TaxID=1392251 RepID=A0A9P4P4Q3_9PLEO|nr:hypothetical protein P171DRAFT_437795 [Karstenula rhodostoma CBS 690.94]
MEPPAKRMRILQSIGVDEVDESNPEYIKGKQQNGERLKNKFEAIFAKFGAMSDMMSDELDMRGEGSVVVDRGHMKKLDKEYRNRLGRRTRMPEDEHQLVDDLFANDEEMGVEEEGEEECDEKDELAPSQSPEPVLQKSTTDQHVSLIARSNGQTDIPVPNTPTNATLQATLAASANPAADLLQLVQFPQTPAGQQARKAFEAQTAQAVQQAVASIFSSLLSNVPTLQSPQLSLQQAPETPAVPPIHTTETAPATAPSLYRPPPVISDTPAASRSSPVPVPPAERRKRRSFAVGVHIKPRRKDSIRPDVPLSVDNAALKTAEEDASEPSANNETSNIDPPTNDSPLERSGKPRRGPTKKYVFTPEEDQYIIESRVLHKRPWAEIINNQPQWRDWNKNTFWQRWCNKLKEQAAEMERSGELASLRARIDAEAGLKDSSSMNERPEAQPHSSLAGRHLPTPSSLGHDEDIQPDDEPDFENPEDLIASGGHFDDDEKDLLSLYGDRPMCNVQTDPLGDGDTDSDPGDAREIPETPLNLTQESSVQAVLQGTMTREPTVDVCVAASSQTAKVPPKKDSTNSAESTPHVLPTKKPSPKSKSKPKPTSTPTLHTCPLCHQTFPTAALLHTHTTHPHPREIHISTTTSSPLPTPTPANAPSTPNDVAIKREPRDTDDLLSTPTPASAPHSSSTSTTTTTPKSAGKLLPRAAYNAVKRSWARGARGATTPAKGKRKRQTLDTAPRKRFWDGEGSEDELGM